MTRNARCKDHRTPQPFCPLCPVPEQDRATPEQITAHRQRARHLAANPPSEEDQ